MKAGSDLVYHPTLPNIEVVRVFFSYPTCTMSLNPAELTSLKGFNQTKVSLMFDIGYSHVNISRMSAECL